jgi:hypothetical protein
MNIKTPQGSVTLLEPTVELLRAIRSLLPFGALRFTKPERGATFGLVMQCGETELLAVKRQPVDCDERRSRISYVANSILIAHSLRAFLGHGFSGLFLPCAYLRQKPGGRFESGIAWFGYPSVHGHETQEYPFQPAWDGQFCHGFTQMMLSFLHALQESSEQTGITLPPAIGLDVRRRTQLGSLGFGFMVIGPHVVCLRTAVSSEDPAWTTLRSVGIAEVYHLPSIPMTINESQLAIAKPVRTAS